MIPLRVIHVLDPAVAATTRAGAASLLPWLAAQGHANTCLHLGAAGTDGFQPCLGRRAGWWAWWRRDRRAAIAAAAGWGGDLVHAHGEAALGTALEIARGIASPVVAEPATLADPLAARQLRDAAVAAVLVPGEEARSILLAAVHLPRERVVVVPPGVDAATPSPRPADGSLVVAARLRRRSDLQALLEAVRACRAGGLAVTAVVSLAPGLPVPEDAALRVVPAGAELAAADVMVELATADLPMPHIVDALAAGRPVVAVSAGLLPELVMEGGGGVLLPPGDHEGLAGALRQLAAVDHRAVCAAAARQAARRHDIALVGETVVSVYRAAIGGGQADAAKTWKRLTTERLRRRNSGRQRAAGSGT